MSRSATMGSRCLSSAASDVIPRDRSGNVVGRIPELDGLRALLAWTVVLVHTLIFSGWFGFVTNSRNLLFEIAEAAVDLFILLSGFAITRLRIETREPLVHYFRRRTCRILPAYWVALAISTTLLPVTLRNLRQLPFSADIEPFITVCQVGLSRFWPDLITHVFLVHGLVPATRWPFIPFTLLGVAWSLSLEEQFYAVAPFAVRWARKSRVVLATIICTTAVAALANRQIIAAFSSGFLPAKLSFFLTGSLSYFALKTRSAYRAVIGLILVPCALLGLLLSIGSPALFEPWLAATVWAVLLVAIRTHSAQILRRFLNSAPLQKLGRVSYSTYLFHGAVLTCVQWAVWRLVAPTARVQLLIATATLSIPATYGISLLAWRWIEKPFQRLGRGEPLLVER